MNEAVAALVLVLACAFSYGISWLWLLHRPPSRYLAWIRYLLIAAAILSIFDLSRPWMYPLCCGLAAGALLPAA